MPVLARLALELVVPAGLVHGTMVLALWVLVPLALAVLELAPLNPVPADRPPMPCFPDPDSYNKRTRPKSVESALSLSPVEIVG
jgi:hypothetical protein